MTGRGVIPESALYKLACAAATRLNESRDGAYGDDDQYWRVETVDEDQRDYLVLSRSTQAGRAETVRVRVRIEEVR